jgi:hypothetical protein
MRIGVAWEFNNSVYYRVGYPMKLLEMRGHEVVWQPDDDAEAHLRRLGDCDLVHVYRRANDLARGLMRQLSESGTAITYDNDDDFASVPKESPHYEATGGLKGQRIFAETVKAAKLARVFTTPSQVLADKYRGAGVERVELIPNLLAPGVDRSRRPHDGLVIGWIAGAEHRADLARIPLVDALQRILAKHEHVRVECIGVDLGLPERYRHDPYVPFPELPDRIGGFDVGIAPLADMPWNWARSDIKVKEYAASGVPWLASPVGPYAGLGDEQGGRLVADEGWFEALDRLIESPRERTRLGRAAGAWAETQLVWAAADRWLGVFAEATGSAAIGERQRPDLVLPSGGKARVAAAMPGGRIRPRRRRGQS